MYDKKKFLMNFLPDSVEDLQLVMIDLEMTGLTICDILRNINRVYPQNSNDRFKMIDGKKAIAVVCKSELLDPISGIVLLIGGDLDIQIKSRNYMLISIDERDIRDEESLNRINTEIMVYLAKQLTGVVPDFVKFSNRPLYNDYEDLEE